MGTYGLFVIDSYTHSLKLHIYLSILQLNFKALISPVAPFSVAGGGERVEKQALFYYDLAALLSSVLRLRGGVTLKWARGMLNGFGLLGR